MTKPLNELFIDLANEFPKCNIYLYGSQVYQTTTPLSDFDFIVVGDIPTSSEKRDFGDLHLYDWDDFETLLLAHDISALECLFLNASQKHEVKPLSVTLDLAQLRTNCSTKASNSWVKAKKKVEVENEPYIAQKSLFHSLRILTFAIQLAETGKINFIQTNLWNEVNSLPINWGSWNNHFKSRYNALKSHLRTLCPKE